MKWITTDYKGNKKVWYSEEVLEKIIQKLKDPNNCTYSGKPLVFVDNMLEFIEEIK